MQDSPDDVVKAKQILDGEELARARVKYLENEGWEFCVDRKETKGYQWKVWGSPVSAD